METIKFKIEGMHCGACATGIQMGLTQLEGIKSAFIDYNAKEGVVEFDSAKTTKEQVLKTVEELGYKASLI